MADYETIKTAIANRATQKQVAALYGEALRESAHQSGPSDWPRINAAVIARWNIGALNRIKHWAWKIATEKKPTGGPEHRGMPR